MQYSTLEHCKSRQLLSPAATRALFAALLQEHQVQKRLHQSKRENLNQTCKIQHSLSVLSAGLGFACCNRKATSDRSTVSVTGSKFTALFLWQLQVSTATQLQVKGSHQLSLAATLAQCLKMDSLRGMWKSLVTTASRLHRQHIVGGPEWAISAKQQTPSKVHIVYVSKHHAFGHCSCHNNYMYVFNSAYAQHAKAIQGTTAGCGSNMQLLISVLMCQHTQTAVFADCTLAGSKCVSPPFGRQGMYT